MDNFKLYRERFPGSTLTDEQLERELLSLNSHSGEVIFFSINYLSRNYKEEAKKGLQKSFNAHIMEIETYYSIAKAKQALLRKEADKHDGKNEYKGKNTPQWFGKSFDKRLFE